MQCVIYKIYCSIFYPFIKKKLKEKNELLVKMFYQQKKQTKIQLYTLSILLDIISINCKLVSQVSNMWDEESKKEIGRGRGKNKSNYFSRLYIHTW